MRVVIGLLSLTASSLRWSLVARTTTSAGSTRCRLLTGKNTRRATTPNTSRLYRPLRRRRSVQEMSPGCRTERSRATVVRSRVTAGTTCLPACPRAASRAVAESPRHPSDEGDDGLYLVDVGGAGGGGGGDGAAAKDANDGRRDGSEQPMLTGGNASEVSDRSTVKESLNRNDVPARDRRSIASGCNYRFALRFDCNGAREL